MQPPRQAAQRRRRTACRCNRCCWTDSDPPDVILDYTEFDTFLDIYLYRNKDALIGDLVERVIAPAEHKIEDILTRRSRLKDKLFGSSATRPSSSDA
jgi:hypothetical protein